MAFFGIITYCVDPPPPGRSILRDRPREASSGGLKAGQVPKKHWRTQSLLGDFLFLEWEESSREIGVYGPGWRGK